MENNNEGAKVKLYFTSVSSNKEIKSAQVSIRNILDSKKIPYVAVDVSVDKALLTEMRTLCEEETALPPRLFTTEDKYLGDFQSFQDANEDGELNTFLQL